MSALLRGQVYRALGVPLIKLLLKLHRKVLVVLELTLILTLRLVELKLSLENAALRRASRLPEPSVVVCDRGALDSRAYCADAAAWGRVLALGGWSEAGLAGRYDACVHLSGAPEDAYGFGNAARTELCRIQIFNPTSMCA